VIETFRAVAKGDAVGEVMLARVPAPPKFEAVAVAAPAGANAPQVVVQTGCHFQRYDLWGVGSAGAATATASNLAAPGRGPNITSPLHRLWQPRESFDHNHSSAGRRS